MPSPIQGRILNEAGRPIANVRISLNGKAVAASAKDGFFSVASPRTRSNLALTFATDGYVSNTKIFDPKASGLHSVVMWPIAYRVRFDPTRELDIELGSSHIVIPANVLTGSAGEKITSHVTLQYTWFDVTNSLQRAAAPGNFSGRMLDRRVQRLNSYGIVDLVVTDAKGRALGLRAGRGVELALPVPQKLVSQAPRQVGFFDFDLSSGQWIEDGPAELDTRALVYTVVIHRFPGPDGSTAHNLDDPQDTTCVRVQVVSFFDGSPLAGFTAIAHGAQYDYQTTTDSNGYACFLVQRNASFWVEAYGVFQGSLWGATGGPTFTSPNVSYPDCSDPCCCPILGAAPLSPTVGRSPSLL
jgi:hypothetical protein